MTRKATPRTSQDVEWWEDGLEDSDAAKEYAKTHPLPIVRIDPREFVDPVNAEFNYTETGTDEYWKSVSLRDPVLIGEAPTPGAKRLKFDGFHRMVKAILLGRKTIPAVVIPKEAFTEILSDPTLDILAEETGFGVEE